MIYLRFSTKKNNLKVRETFKLDHNLTKEEVLAKLDTLGCLDNKEILYVDYLHQQNYFNYVESKRIL